ncbi:MAG: hypothetical protein JSC189_001310 [Candidatus Tokpelaia sp. JSC189]|nr:MAG: hypothetical protein JSC189_001310 [Candidatus Tokpelaia sp. JSC189]
MIMSFLRNDEYEAKLYYKGNDYQIITPGSYVICAVTGKRIALDDLRYWNFRRQEAYANCQVSYERELECNPNLRKLLEHNKD